jgi:O-antigen ligase
MKFGTQIFGMLIIAALLVLLAVMNPSYFSSITYLGGLLLLEVILASVWHYEKWFFTILMVIFLWAGSSLPLSGTALAARWVFLMVGGFVGVVKWGARGGKRSFSVIHLVALLCIVAALVSVMVSKKAQLSLLKSSSLLLQFLYVSSGARIAMADREAAFFKGLVTACEALSFLSGFCYVVLRNPLFGNPNSLGAVMGVGLIPILTWGVLISADRQVRHRRTAALFVAGYLLLSSGSRAGFLASAVALTVMCIGLRRGMLLLKGGLVLAFLITAFGVLQPEKIDSLVSSFTEQIVYKGKMEQGILGSRRTPWQDTVAVIKESPWFGGGFGTDSLPGQTGDDSPFRTVEGANREHGSSYMALLQYLGLLGAVPFVILLLLIISQIVRTFLSMRRTGDPQNYAIPLAMLCLAGLLHAFFEDWLIAPGYYLALLFWTSAFLLSDVLPRRTANVRLVDSMAPTRLAGDPQIGAFAAK